MSRPYRQCRMLLVPADYTASRIFYEQALGLPVLEEFAEGAGVLLGVNDGAALELLVTPFGPRPPGIRLALEVESVDERRAALVAGGALCTEIETHPWGHRSFMTADPDGNALTLYEVVDR